MCYLLPVHAFPYIYLKYKSKMLAGVCQVASWILVFLYTFIVIPTNLKYTLNSLVIYCNYAQIYQVTQGYVCCSSSLTYRLQVMP